MPDPSSDAQELRALEEKRRTSGLTPVEEARRAALQGAEPPRAAKGFDIRAAAAGVRALLADDAGAPPRPAASAPAVRDVAGLPAPPPPPRPAAELALPPAARPLDAPSNEPPPPAPTAIAASTQEPSAGPAPAAPPPSGDDEAERSGEPAQEPELVSEPELIEDAELIEELEPIDEEPALAASAPLRAAAAEAPATATVADAPPPPATAWMVPPPPPDEPRPAETYPASLELLAPVEEPSVPRAAPVQAVEAPAARVEIPEAPAEIPAAPAEVSVAPVDLAVADAKPEEAPARAPLHFEALEASASSEPPPAAADAPPTPPARYTAADYGLDPADPASAAWAAWYASQGWDPATAYAWAERMHSEAAGAPRDDAAAAPAGEPAAPSDLRFEAAPAPGGASAEAEAESEPTAIITTFEPAGVEAPAEPGTGDASGFMVPAPAAAALVPVPAEEEIAIDADLDASPGPTQDGVAFEDGAEDVALSEEELADAPLPGTGPDAFDLPAEDALLPDDALGPAVPLGSEEPFGEELPLGDDPGATSMLSLTPAPAPAQAEDAARFELADSGTFSHAPLGLVGSADLLPGPPEDETPGLEGLEWVQTSAVPGDELPVDLSTFEQPPARSEDPSEHATVVWSLGQRGHTPAPTTVRAPPREVPETLDVLEDDILELPDGEVPAAAPDREDVTSTDTFPALTPPAASAAPETLDDRTLMMPLGGRALPRSPAAPPAPGGAHVPGTHRVVVHTSEGEVRRGTLTDASLDGKELVLHPQGGGAPTPIATDEVKAVFFMLPTGAPAPEVTGQRVRVTFRDGRQVAGFSADYDPEKFGFFMVPADSRTHTERIWVYRAAVRQVVVS